VDYTATLFYSIPLKPCRDRRPRRSEKQQILLFMWLPIIAGCKLKILSFFGPSRTPVPTGKKFKPHQHTDTERKPYRFRGVEVSLRLVSQGDLPSANSRSDTTPWCHSLRSRRFATSTPTGKNSNRIDTPLHLLQLTSVSGQGWWSLTAIGSTFPSVRKTNRNQSPNKRQRQSTKTNKKTFL